ncbi:sensor histidine kinase [Amycolatopsis australiensis]|uniref:histidine kinase n=1 Tax=Amycolatopsis australiensis TaxID=546364 RepID=A0A1K1SWV8_9PSEU|nr:sensor histidine kinase [Amycolatopsis australiensis]SFW88543.1 Signal transduction histidine kinase [Amycolatopsis australiensis]
MRTDPATPEGRWARLLLAPARGLALSALGVAELGALALTVVAAHASFLLHLRFTRLASMRWTRVVTGLQRRLARAWAGVEIPEPYSPAPAPPRPDADGLYRDGTKLHRSARIPRYRQTVRWMVDDDATWRDLAWLLLDSLLGTPLMAVPATLLCAGIALPAGVVPTPAGAWAVVSGVALVAAGLVLGPVTLRQHALAAKRLLAPTGRSRIGGAARAGLRAGRALGRLGAVAAMAVVELAVAALLIVSVVPLHVLGIGWLWWEIVVTPVRELAQLRRRLVTEWTGVAIPEAYLPPPAGPVARPDGLYREGNRLYRSRRRPVQIRRQRWIMSDVASRRELLWLVTDPVLVLGLALPLMVPALLALFALIWPWLWWPIAGLFLRYDPAGPWHRLLAELPPLPGWCHHPLTGIATGLALFAVGISWAPALLRAHNRWARLMLSPAKGTVLAQRVAHLDRTRTVATAAQAAELRRIERDLHDGSQARLLAIGLKLDLIPDLVDTDPEAAKAVAEQAREAAGQAMQELRDLVRGIHPPVLAERGLADAIRALAIDSPLDVGVRVDLPGRLEHPLETAVYFAVSELLTNATKHARANRVDIALSWRAGTLTVTVTDDGRGGADPAGGSGLDGIAHRLAPFDGTFTITSPPGGPTVATATLPVTGWS